MISTILLSMISNEYFELDTILYLLQLTLVKIVLVFSDDTFIINVAKSVNTSGNDLLKQQ